MIWILRCPWVLMGLALLGCRAAPLARFECSRACMGTVFRVVLYAADGEQAASAFEAAFQRASELDAKLSDYDSESEVSRLGRMTDGRSRPTRAPVSRDLQAVLSTAQAVSAATDGAFDVTVGPLVRLWRRAFRRGQLPDPEQLAEAGSAVGWRKLLLRQGRGEVELAVEGMRLDLGGVAKGYALDELLRVLAAQGIERALVDGGGDVAASAPPPGRSGWRVAVVLGGAAGPEVRGHVLLVHGALATSGALYRSLTLEGITYSHILDPRTGRALTTRAAASVRAPSGALADALASALCVSGLGGVGAFIEPMEGVEGQVIVLEPENVQAGACESSGWNRMMVERSEPGPPNT